MHYVIRKFLLSLALFSTFPLHANTNKHEALAAFEEEMRTFAGPHEDYIQAIMDAVAATDKSPQDIVDYGKSLSAKNLTLFKNRRPLSVRKIIVGLLESDRSPEELEELTTFNREWQHRIENLIADDHCLRYAMVFVAMIEAGMSAQEMETFTEKMETREQRNLLKDMDAFARAQYMVKEAGAEKREN